MRSIVAAGFLLVVGQVLAIEKQSPVPPLSLVRRVYVEALGGGKDADQMRDMIIAAFQNSGLFVITENRESADATLRGSADDKVFRSVHNSSDSIGLHTATGFGSASSSRIGGSSSARGNAGAGVTENENSKSEENQHEASASVRLIDDEGDVIWSTTQESGGAKFRGAMADVADKVVRQLSAEVGRARSEAARRTKPE